MISASELDRQVRIQAKATTRDADYGSEVLDPWSTFATVWAGIRDIAETGPGGGEASSRAERTSTRRSTVKIRDLPGLKSDMRVVDIDNGRVLQIVGITEIGRRQGHLLLCEDYSG